MFPTKLFLSTALIYTYLILVYTRAMSGDHGFFALGDNAMFQIAANTALISCSGALGMACFAFGFRRLSERLRRRAPFYVAGLCAVGELCLDFVPQLFSFGVALSVFGWGFLTAHILYRTAMEVPATHFGRFIGVSYGLSAFLQFVIGTADALLPTLPLTKLVALPCLAAFAFLSRGKDNDENTDAALPAQEGSPAWHAFFLESRVHLLLGAALLSLLMGFSDSVTVMHFDEFAPAFPASRLCYAVGLVFFGWLADRSFAVLPAIVLLMNAYYLWFRGLDSKMFLPLSQIVETICSGPTIILLTAGFLHAAARSTEPERWAAMGRIVGLPMTSFGLAFGLWLWPVVSTTTMLAVYTTLLLVAVVLLYRGTLSYLGALKTVTEAQSFSVAPASASTVSATPMDAPLSPPAMGSKGRPADEAFATGTENSLLDEPLAAETTDLSFDEIFATGPSSCQSVEESALPHGTSESTASEANSGDAFSSYCRRYKLTVKESEILVEILKGQSVDDIAETHFITKRTVRFHISNLLHKTGNKSQLALTAHYFRTADADLLSEENANQA